jgi:hypothetical protein
MSCAASVQDIVVTDRSTQLAQIELVVGPSAIPSYSCDHSKIARIMLKCAVRTPRERSVGKNADLSEIQPD